LTEPAETFIEISMLEHDCRVTKANSLVSPDLKPTSETATAITSDSDGSLSQRE